MMLLSLGYGPGAIKADYVYLANGSIISGVLTEEKEKLLTYRVAYGEIFINRENIVKIVPETKDKPLLREAEKYLKDKNFKRAIKTCGEVLEIEPDSSEALAFKKTAVEAWRKYEEAEAAKVAREKAEREQKKAGGEQKAPELEKASAELKNKWGLAIKGEKGNYLISEVYYNCPLNKGEIKPGDVLVDIQGTKVAVLPFKKVYDFLLLNNITITTQRSVILTREKILWQAAKEYVGLGISLENVEAGSKVTNLMPNGPAARAGVLKDDLIINLAGQTISSLSMDKVIEIIKGEAGKSLKAVIERRLTLK